MKCVHYLYIAMISHIGRFRAGSDLLCVFQQQAEDAKEDFSHLPPNQQRKKLNEKIEQIKQEISKETAER